MVLVSPVSGFRWKLAAKLRGTRAEAAAKDRLGHAAATLVEREVRPSSPPGAGRMAKRRSKSASATAR
jgi:hypothetical protein